MSGTQIGTADPDSGAIGLVLGKMEGVRKRGDYWMARCPAHEDAKASLSIKQGTDQPVILHCHAGCDLAAVLDAAGLTMADISTRRERRDAGEWTPRGPAIATYDYTDEHGELLFQVCRTADKEFPQRRHDPDDPSRWSWKLGTVRRVPYRLPQLVAAVQAGKTVYVVEGEKDVHAVEAAGGVATCNPGGAGKWRTEYDQHFRGADVVIIADRDQPDPRGRRPGAEHAGDVARHLQPVAKSVLVVEAAEGKDAADHLAAGHGLDEFRHVDTEEEGHEGHSAVPATHSLVPGEEFGGQEGQWPVPQDRASDVGEQEPGTRGTGLTAPPRRVTAWTAERLRDWSFPEPRWAVPGVIAEGVTLLGGAPKIGKSWLALGLGVAIASGGKALGSINVDQGPVLYLALEDTGRRLQSRLTKVFQHGEAWPAGLVMAVECPPLPEGGAERITGWLAKTPDARLVVIDVFERVRGRPMSQQSAYSADYAAVKMVKTIADEYGVAMILVHHVRKAGSDDFTDLISGTNGLAAAADTIAVLKRARGELDGILHVVGRDVEENEYAMRFAANLAAWQILGQAETFGLDETRKKILLYVRAHDGATPKAIAEGTGLPYETAKKAAQRMSDAGQLDTDGHGRYLIPVPLVPEAQTARPETESSGTTSCPPLSPLSLAGAQVTPKW